MKKETSKKTDKTNSSKSFVKFEINKKGVVDLKTGKVVKR